MLRKLFYLISIGLLIFLISFLYLRLENKSVEIVENSIFKAVPRDAGLVLHSDKPIEFLHRIHNDNLVWQQFRELSFFQEISMILGNIDSVLTSPIDFEIDLSNASICLSLHPKGNDGLIPLLILKAPEDISKTSGLALIRSILDGEFVTSEKSYNDFTIVSLKDSLNALKGAYFVKNEMMVWSSSDLLLEKSIGEISASLGLEADESFSDISQTAGQNVEANVYVNFGQFGTLMENWIKSEQNTGIDLLKSIGSWAVLDFHTTGQAILLDGFMNYANADDFLNRLKNQDPVSFHSVDIIPQNMRYFYSMGITDLDQYFLYYPSSVAKKKQLDDWAAKWSKQYGRPAEGVLRNLFGGEITYLTDLDGKNVKQYVIVKEQSHTTAQEYFEDFLTTINANGETVQAKQSGIIKVDDETSYTYYNFPLNELFAQYFGPLFNFKELGSVVFFNNFLVMGKNPAQLKELLYVNLLGQTMDQSQEFKEFSTNLSARSNFQWYMDFRVFEPLMEDLFDVDFGTHGAGKTSLLKNMNALGFQLIGSKENVYSNMYLDYIGEREEEAQTIWQSLLDSSFVRKPTLVENHYTHEKEICVQDLKNVLYLLSSSGRIIWKKALNEPIMGRIYQIDKYKNGKLQLLFNTSSQIHLLDRNGNYVSRYPVNLASKAVGELGLVDYEKKRDYRIFVPTADKQVRLFDKDGNILEGWRFKGADHPVHSRIHHFKIGTRDFIVFADKGRLYFLNRQGQSRMRLSEQFAKARNSQMYYDENGPDGEACFVTTDEAGDVRYINMNGKVSRRKMGVASKNHYFTYEDLDGDRREEFIFVEGKTLKVFNQKGTKLFNHNFRNTLNVAPHIYHFSNRVKRIGIVDSREDRIYLFEPDGSVVKGFPLKGDTPFTLGFLKNDGTSFNLLVGGSGNFIYNYRVK